MTFGVFVTFVVAIHAFVVVNTIEAVSGESLFTFTHERPSGVRAASISVTGTLLALVHITARPTKG